MNVNETATKGSINLNRYIAPDGLMSLRGGCTYVPYDMGYPPTCDNDNGVLFLATFVCLSNIFLSDINNLFSMLEAKDCPGLYHRNPGRNNYINSHDNYTGMAYLCVRHHDTTKFKEIIKHWPLLNNVNPGKFHWEALHQPHNWFIYNLAAGKEPSWFLTIYFCLNLLYAAFRYRKLRHISELILIWLRCKVVDNRKDLLSKYKKTLVLNIIEGFKQRFYSITDGKGISQLTQLYYGNDPNHPCRQTSLLW